MAKLENAIMNIFILVFNQITVSLEEVLCTVGIVVKAICSLLLTNSTGIGTVGMLNFFCIGTSYICVGVIFNAEGYILILQ